MTKYCNWKYLDITKILTYMHMLTHACMYIPVCTHLFTHIHIHTQQHMNTYVYICIHIHIYIEYTYMYSQNTPVYFCKIAIPIILTLVITITMIMSNKHFLKITADNKYRNMKEHLPQLS